MECRSEADGFQTGSMTKYCNDSGFCRLRLAVIVLGDLDIDAAFSTLDVMSLKIVHHMLVVAHFERGQV